MLEFSEAVKDVLSDSGLNNNDLSKSTGFSSAYIGGLLNGKRRWNEDTINKVSTALNIQVVILKPISTKVCEKKTS